MKKSRKAGLAESPALEPRAVLWPLVYGLLLISIFPMLWWPQDQWVHEDEALMGNPIVEKAQIIQALTTRYWYGVDNRGSSDSLFRPLVLLSAMPFVKIPQGIRLVTWLTFLLCGLLLFFWVRTRLRPDSPWPYLAMTLLLFHPVSAEVRSQVSGLSETMPLLLGAAAFLIAEEHPLLGLALVALAPGFKETGFFWLLGYSLFQLSRRRTTTVISGISLLAGWSVFYYSAVGDWIGVTKPPPMLNPLVTMSFVEGIISRLYLLGHALRLMAAPTDLSVDYSAGTLPLPAGILQFPTLLGLAFLILVARNVRKLVAGGPLGAFLLATIFGTLFWNLHLPGLFGYYYVPLFHERDWLALYFAILLWSGSLVALAETKGIALRQGFTVALAVAATLLLFKTVERQRDWVNSATLLLNDSIAHPQNPRLHFDYGFAAGKIGNWTEARDAFTRAIKCRPEFGEAHYRLSLVYLELNEPAKAKEHEEMATRLGVKTPTPSNP